MADVTVKSLDEFESYRGQFLYVGKGLGVTAWGMNALQLPASWTGYPEHDHVKDGQEEAYIVLAGDATLHTEGHSWHLRPGTLARVGPGERRKIIPGDEGVTILVLGGTPGRAYAPSSLR